MYFKAQMTRDSAPQLFRLQRFLEGRPVDRMADEELYRDPAVMRQLLEFIDGALAILKAAREQKALMPDFRHAIESDERLRITIGGLLLDPRYSGNIFITDQPDAHGERVFFVDTAPNAQERTSAAQDRLAREVIGRLETANFLLWKKKLESVLRKMPQGGA